MHNTYIRPHWSRRPEDRREEVEEYDERAHHHNNDRGRRGRNDRGRGGRNHWSYHNHPDHQFRPQHYSRPQYQDPSVPFHEGDFHLKTRDQYPEPSVPFHEGDSRLGTRNHPINRYPHGSYRATVDMGSKRGTKKPKDGSSTQGGVQKNRNTQQRRSPSQKNLSQNSYSDTDFDEIAGGDGEDIMWEETHEVYNDVVMNLPDVDEYMGDHDAEQYISEAAKVLGLERTSRMKIMASPLNKCSVPTPPRDLPNKFFRLEGFQKGNELVTEEKNTTFIVLEPVLKEAPSIMTNTLAEEFIRNPSKLWWNNSSFELQTSIPYYHKLLLWARMMLVSEEDKAMLLKADIFRGVLAFLYHVPINTSLVAAFLTFWNTEGHTLVTAQGEMGYPLIAMYDAMGIPISGHLYEEYIPLESEVSGIVQVLHTAYTDIWVLNQNGSFPNVTLQSWIDHFIGEDLGDTVKTKAQMPRNFYADPEDPLLSRLDFRTLEFQKSWSARFSSNRIFHQQRYGREVYRAAFIAAWLCTYCVPVHMGASIRPEVFCAAARLAQGVRLAIGTASMAHLYQSLDNVCQNIIAGSRSASECQLSVPAHFIMGWFSSYWKITPSQPGVNPKITHFPPFVTDAWRITSAEVSLYNAHRLFIDLADDKKSLLSLSFLGKSCIRFPKSESEVLLSDARESTDGGRNNIRITTIDMLISSSVGAVTHTRCQVHHNLVYCPHRFSRMHACDQDVPDFLMEGSNGQFLLQFPTYLKGTREETIEHLQRKHLAYYFPMGHRFHLQPLSRRTKRSVEYVKWCMSALGFLTNADIICSGQEPPHTLQVEQTNAPSTTVVAANISNDEKETTKDIAQASTRNQESKKTSSAVAENASKAEKKSAKVVVYTSTSNKRSHKTNPGVTTTGASQLSKKSHAASKAKTKEAPNPVANSSKEIRLVSEKQNTVSVEKGVTASSDSGTIVVDSSTDEDTIAKRSRSEEMAARFLKVSRSRNAGGDKKKGAVKAQSPAPVTANSEVVSSQVEAAVLKNNNGKRSSPQRESEGEKADLVRPDVGDNEPDVTTEKQGNHSDDSPVKKQRLYGPVSGEGHDLEMVLSKAATLKSTIDQTIKCYLDAVGDEFTSLKRDSELKEATKYGERNGIVVPRLADPDLNSMMGYVRSDLKRIHKWIAAPILDKAALSIRIGNTVNRWRTMLQNRIPVEVQELMNELEHLKVNLASKVEHAVPFSVSSLRADEEHVKERLTMGHKSHDSIMLGLNSLKDYEEVWASLEDGVKQQKEKQLMKIKELNDALGNARSKLFLEKEYEEKLKQHHSQYTEIVSGASNALSCFEDTLAQGSSCLESINKAIEEAGSLGDSELPVSLREQLKFVESCVIEGAEENDE